MRVFKTNLFTLLILFQLINFKILSQTTETEPNDNLGDGGIKTISAAGTYEGSVDGNTDAEDLWKIPFGASGGITISFTIDAGTSAETTVPICDDLVDYTKVYSGFANIPGDGMNYDVVLDGSTYYVFRVDCQYNGTVNYTITISLNGGSLPVELVSFEGYNTEEGVMLTWETATEENNYGFEIQRSVISDQQSVDNWEKIGFVEGHGNSNVPNQYEFIDNEPPTGQLEYRLKQIDFDGTATYYGTTASVSYGVTSADDEILPTEFNLSQNYPNPFNPSTTISFSIPATADKLNSQFVTLKIYDILGNEVATLVNETKAPGNYQVEFNAFGLSSGFYIYKLSVGNNFTSQKKMLLVK